MSDEPPADAGGSEAPDAEHAATGERDAITYLYWGGFATLLALAFLATVRFYLSASRAIEIWIAPDFEPAFQAVFNLAVSWPVRLPSPYLCAECARDVPSSRLSG